MKETPREMYLRAGWIPIATAMECAGIALERGDLEEARTFLRQASRLLKQWILAVEEIYGFLLPRAFKAWRAEALSRLFIILTLNKALSTLALNQALDACKKPS